MDPVTRQDFWQLLIKLVVSDGEGGFAVIISTPYMDEAARCHRVGFLKQGQLIAQGTPGQLRALLDNRIVELRGEPLPLLKKITATQPGVEDVRSFGDRLHIRVQPEQANAVIQNLKQAITEGGSRFIDARSVPPVLEDVFISLSEQESVQL